MTGRTSASRAPVIVSRPLSVAICPAASASQSWSDPRAAFEATREAGCDNVKLLADLFHMNIEESDILGAFRKAKGRIVGSDQFLTKPFSKEELLGAIQAHVPGFAAVQPHQAH